MDNEEIIWENARLTREQWAKDAQDLQSADPAQPVSVEDIPSLENINPDGSVHA